MTLMKLEFSRQFFKKSPVSNFMKSHAVGAELFHVLRLTDRWTDMTKLTVDFRNFANAPKNCHKEQTVLRISGVA
jgi:hypothetical protein